MTQEPKTEQLSFDCELKEPPARVWRALTEPALLAAWLMPNDFAPVVGHACTFREPAGEIACTVLEVDPERRLRLHWRDDAADSVVTFTLRPAVGGGTHLRLVHSGLPAQLREVFPLLASSHAAPNRAAASSHGGLVMGSAQVGFTPYSHDGLPPRLLRALALLEQAATLASLYELPLCRCAA